MFERFTEHAIKVIMLAQEEARLVGHNFVGTEQILLGLIRQTKGIASTVLTSQGVTLEQARIEVEKIIGRGSGFVAVEIPFTPRAKRLLELSWQEARVLGVNYIGTEHLLLGLIREGEGVASRVLENLGINIGSLSPEIMKLIGETAKTTTANQKLEEEFGLDKLNKQLVDICRRYFPDDIVSAVNNLATTRLRKEQAIKDQTFDEAARLREVESQLVEDLKERLHSKKLDKELLAIFSYYFPDEIVSIVNNLASTRRQKEQALKDCNFDIAAKLRESEVQMKSDLKGYFKQNPLPHQQLTPMDKFSDGVMKVISLARNETRRLGHNQVGTEQMFIALIEENTGITGKVFQSCGVYLEEARIACETIISKNCYPDSAYMPFTLRLNEVLLLSEKKATDYGLLYIKKEHLLLALLEEDQGAITTLRKNLSIDKNRIKEELTSLINEKDSEE